MGIYSERHCLNLTSKKKVSFDSKGILLREGEERHEGSFLAAFPPLEYVHLILIDQN